jgi:hypothetical protein
LLFRSFQEQCFKTFYPSDKNTSSDVRNAAYAGSYVDLVLRMRIGQPFFFFHPPAHFIRVLTCSIYGIRDLHRDSDQHDVGSLYLNCQSAWLFNIPISLSWTILQHFVGISLWKLVSNNQGRWVVLSPPPRFGFRRKSRPRNRLLLIDDRANCHTVLILHHIFSFSPT